MWPLIPGKTTGQERGGGVGRFWEWPEKVMTPNCFDVTNDIVKGKAYKHV
jgi:hypothetical protein